MGELEAHGTGSNFTAPKTWRHLGIELAPGPWVAASAMRARETSRPPPAIQLLVPPLQTPRTTVHSRVQATANTNTEADGVFSFTRGGLGRSFLTTANTSTGADRIFSFTTDGLGRGRGSLLRGDLTRELEVLGRLRASTLGLQVSPSGETEARRAGYTALDRASLENVRASLLARYYDRGPSLASAHDSPLISRMNANSSRGNNSFPVSNPVPDFVPTHSSSRRRTEFTNGDDNNGNGNGNDDDDDHIGRFQHSSPRSPPLDVGDRYEFPALPAGQPMRQATGPTRQSTQPRHNFSPPQRNFSPRQRPLTMFMPLKGPRPAAVPHRQLDPTRTPTTNRQSNSVDGTIPRKLAEEASVLLELYSQSTYEDSENELQNRETIKTVLDSVNKIWDSLSEADKGKEASVASVTAPRSSECKCLTNGGRRITELESDPTLSPYSGCVICYNAVANAVLMPCHHLVLCVVSSGF